MIRRDPLHRRGDHDLSTVDTSRAHGAGPPARRARRNAAARAPHRHRRVLPGRLGGPGRAPRRRRPGLRGELAPPPADRGAAAPGRRGPAAADAGPAPPRVVGTPGRGRRWNGSSAPPTSCTGRTSWCRRPAVPPPWSRCTTSRRCTIPSCATGRRWPTRASSAGLWVAGRGSTPTRPSWPARSSRPSGPTPSVSGSSTPGSPTCLRRRRGARTAALDRLLPPGHRPLLPGRRDSRAAQGPAGPGPGLRRGGGAPAATSPSSWPGRRAGASRR